MIKQLLKKLLQEQQEQVVVELLKNMEGMAERNAKRMAAIKEEMGTKYILHPSHKRSKLEEPRPV